FQTLLTKQKGRIIIALFASNIRRIERLLKVIHSQGKRVALAGRSMNSYTKLAHALSALNIPEDTLVPLANIHDIPKKNLVILCTGSQAEPQSALLRMATGTHKDVQVDTGDLIMLSSRFIPGNERAITNMIDNLYRAGADVLYESIHQIHVSGHGFQDELMMMLNSVKPECFIPIHGEYRHLAKHALLAERSGVKRSNIRVIENGQIVELSAKVMELGDRLNMQKTVIVENEAMHRSPEIFSQRNSLAKTGIVFCTFLIDHRTHRLLMEPVVSAYGVLYREIETDPNLILDEASHAMRKLYRNASKSDDFLETARIELRRFFKQRASHKPVAIPLMLEI
ncbi:MAG: ribonuclease J, partial [Deltaproteobacteria bacterium]|nr:ribonuclease J [Deltaproteobacteria bacterium]